MRNIFWCAVCQIYKKKGFSLLCILMMTVAVAVMFYALVLYNYHRYPLRQAKHILQHDIEHVYKPEYRTVLALMSEEEMAELYMFYKEVGELEGIDMCGMYACMYNYEADMEELYVQKDIMRLCDLKTVHGTAVIPEETELYGGAYVGCELADIYPKGSIYTTSEGEKYLVLDVLDKGSQWLFETVGGSVIQLDHAVLLDYDYLLGRDLSHLKMGVNNYYFVAENEDMPDAVLELADRHSLTFYGVSDLNNIYRSYIRSGMYAGGETYGFSLLLYFASVIAVMMASITTLLSNKKDYGIMLANGMTKREVAAVILLENLFKLLVSCMVAALYWLFNLSRFESAFYIAVSDGILATAALGVVTVAFISAVPIILLRRYRLSDMLG